MINVVLIKKLLVIKSLKHVHRRVIRHIGPVAPYLHEDLARIGPVAQHSYRADMPGSAAVDM